MLQYQNLYQVSIPRESKGFSLIQNADFFWQTNHTLAQHCLLEQTSLSQSLLLCFSQRDTRWENSEPKEEKCSALESRNCCLIFKRGKGGREKSILFQSFWSSFYHTMTKTHNIIYITSKTVFLSKASNKESIYLHWITNVNILNHSALGVILFFPISFSFLLNPSIHESISSISQKWCAYDASL